MDWDDFTSGLLSDAGSFANTATLGGQADILGDITGLNVAPSFLQKNGISTGSNSSVLLIIFIIVVLFVVLEKK